MKEVQSLLNLAEFLSKADLIPRACKAVLKVSSRLYERSSFGISTYSLLPNKSYTTASQFLTFKLLTSERNVTPSSGSRISSAKALLPKGISHKADFNS